MEFSFIYHFSYAFGKIIRALKGWRIYLVYRLYESLVVFLSAANIAFCSARVRSAPATGRVAEGVTKGSAHADAEAVSAPQPNPTPVRSILSRYLT